MFSRGLRTGRGRDAHAPSAMRIVLAAWFFPLGGLRGLWFYAEWGNDEGNKNPAMPWGLRDEN